MRVEIDVRAGPGRRDFASLGQIPKLRQRVLALRGIETVQLLFKRLDVAAHAEAKLNSKDRSGVGFFCADLTRRRKQEPAAGDRNVRGILPAVRCPEKFRSNLG